MDVRYRAERRKAEANKEKVAKGWLCGNSGEEESSEALREVTAGSGTDGSGSREGSHVANGPSVLLSSDDQEKEDEGQEEEEEGRGEGGLGSSGVDGGSVDDAMSLEREIERLKTPRKTPLEPADERATARKGGGGPGGVVSHRVRSDARIFEPRGGEKAGRVPRDGHTEDTDDTDEGDTDDDHQDDDDDHYHHHGEIGDTEEGKTEDEEGENGQVEEVESSKDSGVLSRCGQVGVSAGGKGRGADARGGSHSVARHDGVEGRHAKIGGRFPKEGDGSRVKRRADSREGGTGIKRRAESRLDAPMDAAERRRKIGQRGERKVGQRGASEGAAEGGGGARAEGGGGARGRLELDVDSSMDDEVYRGRARAREIKCVRSLPSQSSFFYVAMSSMYLQSSNVVCTAWTSGTASISP